MLDQAKYVERERKEVSSLRAEILLEIQDQAQVTKTSAKRFQVTEFELSENLLN